MKILERHILVRTRTLRGILMQNQASTAMLNGSTLTGEIMIVALLVKD